MQKVRRAHSVFGLPSGAVPSHPGDQRFVGVERERRERFEREELSLLGVISCLQRPARDVALEPDSDGELLGIVEVRCHEHRVADSSFEPGFFEEFPGRSFTDLFAVVDETCREWPRTPAAWRFRLSL